MNRTVEAEWLDALDPLDEKAARARMDLRRLNFWMGHSRLIASELKSRLEGARRMKLVDMGSGDGTFMLRVAKALPIRKMQLNILLVDKNPAISERTIADLNALGCETCVVQADVFDWLGTTPEVDGIIANLFLHHFSRNEVEAFCQLVSSKTRTFIACEPRRSSLAHFLSRKLGFFGASPVTLHDAPISVRAGFKDREITAAWPSGGWKITERPAGLFSHLFVATRTDTK